MVHLALLAAHGHNRVLACAHPLHRLDTDRLPRRPRRCLEAATRRRRRRRRSATAATATAAAATAVALSGGLRLARLTENAQRADGRRLEQATLVHLAWRALAREGVEHPIVTAGRKGRVVSCPGDGGDGGLVGLEGRQPHERIGIVQVHRARRGREEQMATVRVGDERTVLQRHVTPRQQTVLWHGAADQATHNS